MREPAVNQRFLRLPIIGTCNPGSLRRLYQSPDVARPAPGPYAGGWVDSLLMRLVDVLLSIPSLPLLILINTLYRPGTYMLAGILAVVSWPSDSRLLRGEALALKSREYLDAARVVGVSPAGIIFRYILPNVMPTMLVLVSLTVPALIIAETSLSFLGVGVQAPTPGWGNMLDDAYRFYRTNWTNVFSPGSSSFWHRFRSIWSATDCRMPSIPGNAIADLSPIQEDD